MSPEAEGENVNFPAIGKFYGSIILALPRLLHDSRSATKQTPSEDPERAGKRVGVDGNDPKVNRSSDEMTIMIELFGRELRGCVLCL